MTGSLNRTFHRETVLGIGIGDERIARQHGGGGLYAGIRVEVRSLDRGEGASFAWNAGASIPTRFANAVAEGIQEVISTGVLAGCELTDVLVSVKDGSYHDQDSTDAVFREVAQKATTAALRQARPTVMEAISVCRAVFPIEYATAVEEISSTKGQIESAQSEMENCSVTVIVRTSGVGELLEQVLAATNGHARFSAENGGFRPKPEPPETADVWVSVKSW
jgi:elongation factor G